MSNHSMTGKKRKRKNFTPEEDMKIISYLYDNKLFNVHQIDWDNVSSEIRLSSRNKESIVKRFNRLKNNYPKNKKKYVFHAKFQNYFKSIVDEKNKNSNKRIKVFEEKYVQTNVSSVFAESAKNAFATGKSLSKSPIVNRNNGVEVFGGLDQFLSSTVEQENNMKMQFDDCSNTTGISILPGESGNVFNHFGSGTTNMSHIVDNLHEIKSTLIKNLRKIYTLKRKIYENELKNKERLYGKPSLAKLGNMFETEEHTGVLLAKILEEETKLKELESKLLKQVNEDGVSESREFIQLQVDIMQKRKEEISKEKAVLQQKRSIFFQKKKLFSLQSNSKFSEFPTFQKRYMLLKLLGKGGFSEVWKGFDLLTETKFSCKIHQVNQNWTEEKKVTFVSHVIRECQIIKQLVSPLFINLRDYFILNKTTLVCILEYFKCIDLEMFIKKYRPLPEKFCKSILKQLVNALQILYQKKIIHYDLKPNNVLIDVKSAKVKITDFGLSKIMHTKDLDEGISQTSFGAGTYYYLPPECFSKQEKITHKVDIWSLGIIYYQLLYLGRLPEYASNIYQNQFFKRVQQNREDFVFNFPKGVTVSTTAKKFIKDCLTKDREKRPTINELMKKYESYLNSV